MKSKQRILKKLQKFAVRNRGLPDRSLMHPEREWVIGVLLCFGIVVAGAVYAFSLFERYSDISVDSETVEVESLRYERADAFEALERYKVRAEQYQEFLESAPVVVPVVEPEPVADEDSPGDGEEGAELEIPTEEFEVF